MQLTGTILFFGALIGFLFWLYKVFVELSSVKTYLKIKLGEKLAFNIMPGIVLFIVMAISAGMAWG